ncbi:MAG TPA: DnaB-like helicase N-terminal domain-containing protein, partial [Opitutaceae bacterium]|nr:DnaB-like helicase N-terminal domain-containing protein [Opitutaceae bacterium]
MVEDLSLQSRRPRAAGETAPVTGRAPPHSLEAEQYLLSCCLLDGSDTIARCLEARLSAAAFYSSPHRIIYEKLCEIYQKSPPVELAVLAEELKSAQQLEAVGGYAYLTQISSSIPTTAQAVYFLEKVRELHLLRELIKAATGAVEQCFNYQGGLAEFVDKVEQEIFSVTQARISDAAKPMKEPTREAMNVITKMMMKKGEMTGVPSGFTDLDRL